MMPRSNDEQCGVLGRAFGGLTMAWPLLLVGCVQPDVVRVVDGEAVMGRYVSAAAYAAYARGAEAEARGQDEQALRAFLVAADHDDESVELWTRVGALHCRLGQGDDAERAFGQAEQLDGEYEPLWRARARCAARRGQPRRAAEAARKAASLDPDRQEAVLLVASTLERSGAVEQAGRWYRAAVVRWPKSAMAWRALRDFAQRTDDSTALSWSTAELRAFRAPQAERPPGARAEPRPAPNATSWGAVDQALRHGELQRARQALRRAKLDARMLAARAIALGKPKLAAEQAAHLFAADPADTDSRLALALGADLLGQQGRLLQLLELPPEPLAPSGVGRLLLAELLQRHVGAVAARHWLDESANITSERDDEAMTDLRRRLRARLGPAAAKATPPQPVGATRR